MKFPFKSVLIACSVNTARSCMAEGFLKHCFSKNSLEVKVKSGGIATNARDGMLISIDAQDAMEEIGINLSGSAESTDLKKHRDFIRNADLILTLTEKHKKEIKKFVEGDNKPILTLREFAGEKGDIADPSMKGLEGFRIARDAIIECINKGLAKYNIKTGD